MQHSLLRILFCNLHEIVPQIGFDFDNYFMMEHMFSLRIQSKSRAASMRREKVLEMLLFSSQHGSRYYYATRKVYFVLTYILPLGCLRQRCLKSTVIMRTPPLTVKDRF